MPSIIFEVDLGCNLEICPKAVREDALIKSYFEFKYNLIKAK